MAFSVEKIPKSRRKKKKQRNPQPMPPSVMKKRPKELKKLGQKQLIKKILPMRLTRRLPLNHELLWKMKRAAKSKTPLPLPHLLVRRNLRSLKTKPRVMRHSQRRISNESRLCSTNKKMRSKTLK